MVSLPMAWAISLIAFTMARSTGSETTSLTKKTVNFHIIHWQAFKVGKGGKTTAKVIQGKGATLLLQGFNKLHSIGQV